MQGADHIDAAPGQQGFFRFSYSSPGGLVVAAPGDSSRSDERQRSSFHHGLAFRLVLPVVPVALDPRGSHLGPQ